MLQRQFSQALCCGYVAMPVGIAMPRGIALLHTYVALLYCTHMWHCSIATYVAFFYCKHMWHCSIAHICGIALLHTYVAFFYCTHMWHCSIAHICVSTYMAQVHVKTYKMFMYTHRAKHRVGGARARARYRRRAAYVRLAVVVRRTVDGANDAQQHSARLAAD